MKNYEMDQVWLPTPVYVKRWWILAFLVGITNNNLQSDVNKGPAYGKESWNLGRAVMGIGEVMGELITLTRLGIKGLDELTPSQTISGKRYN